MAAEAGEAGAPSFPGLGQEELRRIVLDDMFTAAWRVLDEEEGGAWSVEVSDFEEGSDEVVISHKADGCVFRRASERVVDERMDGCVFLLVRSFITRLICTHPTPIYPPILYM